MPRNPNTVAVIDLGTNSIRLDIHRLHAGNATVLHREKQMVRLGEGLFPDRKLRPHAVARTIEALRTFRAPLELHQVGRVFAFATSAVREATNRADFLKNALREAGIRIRVLSGTQEARWIAGAILKRERIRGNAALIDIGGGSTEISLCIRRTVRHAKSLRLGVARIAQVHLIGNPPTRDQIDRFRRRVERTLALSFQTSVRYPIMIGSSGTTKGVAQMLRRDDPQVPFSTKELIALNERMASMTKEELLAIPGMEPKRVDLILGGSLLLEACATHFGSRSVRYTEAALKDGILDRVLDGDLS